MNKEYKNIYNRVLREIEYIDKVKLHVGSGKTFIERIKDCHYNVKTLYTIYYSILWFKKYNILFEYENAYLVTQAKIELRDKNGYFIRMITLRKIHDEYYGIEDDFVDNIYLNLIDNNITKIQKCDYKKYRIKIEEQDRRPQKKAKRKI